MKKVKNVIIGFGKGGKTLAGFLRSKNESVVIVEQSDKMYGGTCINVACIPTKTLEYSARKNKGESLDYAKSAVNFENASFEKDAIVSGLRQKNYEKVENAGVEVILGKG